MHGQIIMASAFPLIFGIKMKHMLEFHYLVKDFPRQLLRDSFPENLRIFLGKKMDFFEDCILPPPPQKRFSRKNHTKELEESKGFCWDRGQSFSRILCKIINKFCQRNNELQLKFKNKPCWTNCHPANPKQRYKSEVQWFFAPKKTQHVARPSGIFLCQFGSSSPRDIILRFLIAWQRKVVQNYGTCKSNEAGDPSNEAGDPWSKYHNKWHLNRNQRFPKKNNNRINPHKIRHDLPPQNERKKSQKNPSLHQQLLLHFPTFKTLTWQDILIGTWRDPCFMAYFNTYITLGSTSMSSLLSQRILKYTFKLFVQNIRHLPKVSQSDSQISLIGCMSYISLLY